MFIYTIHFVYTDRILQILPKHYYIVLVFTQYILFIQNTSEIAQVYLLYHPSIHPSLHSSIPPFIHPLIHPFIHPLFHSIFCLQDGKHEAIVKNIHDLLVKLAWDFSPEQLDYLFGCFQRSWVGSSKKQRDELLDFIRHLAEDDKEGIMASKVLELLWNLAHRDDCPPDTMEHALNAHIKILDYSCSQVQSTIFIRKPQNPYMSIL